MYREEEPRFTATSRIISKPIKHRKQRRQHSHDMDISVPDEYGTNGIDDDTAHYNGGANERPFSPPIPQIKQERFSLSKRARKATGGPSATKHSPPVRRQRKGRASAQASHITAESESESDTFGDNGAIVSDSSAKSGYSDAQDTNRSVRQHKALSRYRQRTDGSKRLEDADPDCIQRVMLRSRRKLSSSQAEVVIRPTTTRRSLSAVPAANKPTRPNGRGSTARESFGARGDLRRKSSNKPFSDEDTESSDNVEVMKSSTLEKGQSADAVLRAMSRESRERSERSHYEDETGRKRKGKDREVHNDQMSRQSAEVGTYDDEVDRDESLPPPLQRHKSHEALQDAPIYERRPPDHILASREQSPSDMADISYGESTFSPPPSRYDASHGEFFSDSRSAEREHIQPEDDTYETHQRSVPRQKSPLLRGQLEATSQTVENQSEPEEAQQVFQDTTASLINDAFPVEVLDAVNSMLPSAAPSDAQQQTNATKRRSGPTPVNGKRRRQEMETEIDEEDEVVVQDSAIVRDPHGRMMRKEELLRMLAEHEQSAKIAERASSLEDAEGRIIDEGEVTAQATAAQGQNSDEPEARADVDSDYASDNDHDFNISIARFEVHVEEITVEDDSSTVRDTSLVVTEGIVEDIEESFWDDEAELYVVQQLLSRHRRRSMRNATKPLEREKEMVRSAAGQASPRKSVDQQANASPGPSREEPSRRQSLEDTVMDDNATALQEADAVTDSDVVALPVSPGTNGQSRRQEEHIVANEALSPELAVADTPRRIVPRGSPSKISPTKHRNAENRFRVANGFPRDDHLLQTVDAEDEEASDSYAEPLIAPSVFIRQSTKGTEQQQDAVVSSPTAASTDGRKDVPAQNIMTSPRTPSRQTHARDHAFTPPHQSIPLGDDSSVNSEQRRTRKQSNVYVEIPPSPQGTHTRKFRDNEDASPHASMPIDVAGRTSESRLPETASSNQGTTVEPAFETEQDMVVQEETLQAEQAEGAAHEIDSPTAREGASSTVDAINVMVEEEQAGLADALQGSLVDTTAGGMDLDEPGDTVAGQVEGADDRVESSPSDRATEREGNSNEPSALAATVEEEIEIVTITTLKVTESSSRTQEIIEGSADEVQNSLRGLPDTPVTAGSSSDSEPPSELGVHSTVAEAGEDTVLAGTSEKELTSPGLTSTSSSSSDDSDSSEESDDAEGESLVDDLEKPFKLADLLSWAESLKGKSLGVSVLIAVLNRPCIDEEKPHLITASGAKKLFDQMKLSTEGVCKATKAV